MPGLQGSCLRAGCLARCACRITVLVTDAMEPWTEHSAGRWAVVPSGPVQQDGWLAFSTSAVRHDATMVSSSLGFHVQYKGRTTQPCQRPF
jgi:hypothetical protein